MSLTKMSSALVDLWDPGFTRHPVTAVVEHERGSRAWRRTTSQQASRGIESQGLGEGQCLGCDGDVDTAEQLVHELHAAGRPRRSWTHVRVGGRHGVEQRLRPLQRRSAAPPTITSRSPVVCAAGRLLRRARRRARRLRSARRACPILTTASTPTVAMDEHEGCLAAQGVRRAEGSERAWSRPGRAVATMDDEHVGLLRRFLFDDSAGSMPSPASALGRAAGRRRRRPRGDLHRPSTTPGHGCSHGAEPEPTNLHRDSQNVRGSSARYLPDDLSGGPRRWASESSSPTLPANTTYGRAKRPADPRPRCAATRRHRGRTGPPLWRGASPGHARPRRGR